MIALNQKNINLASVLIVRENGAWYTLNWMPALPEAMNPVEMDEIPSSNCKWTVAVPSQVEVCEQHVQLVSLNQSTSL